MKCGRRLREITLQHLTLNWLLGLHSGRNPGNSQKVETEKYLSDEWIYQTSSVEDKFGGANQTPVGLLDIRVAMAGELLKAAYIGAISSPKN